MAGDWRESMIGALCDAGVVDLQTGPFGSQIHAYDYVHDGAPVVPTEAIRARQIDHSVLPKVSTSKAQELARHRLQLVETVRNNVTIDWTMRENVRAQLRVLVKRILRKHGYPPDKQEQATQTVLEQAALLSGEWAAA